MRPASPAALLPQETHGQEPEGDGRVKRDEGEPSATEPPLHRRLAHRFAVEISAARRADFRLVPHFDPAIRAECGVAAETLQVLGAWSFVNHRQFTVGIEAGVNPTWWWEIQKVGLRRTPKADRRAIGRLLMLFETRAVGAGAILNYPWNWAASEPPKPGQKLRSSTWNRAGVRYAVLQCQDTPDELFNRTGFLWDEQSSNSLAEVSD